MKRLLLLSLLTLLIVPLLTGCTPPIDIYGWNYFEVNGVVVASYIVKLDEEEKIVILEEADNYKNRRFVTAIGSEYYNFLVNEFKTNYRQKTDYTKHWEVIGYGGSVPYDEYGVKKNIQNSASTAKVISTVEDYNRYLTKIF